jgi:hypothetical protein
MGAADTRAIEMKPDPKDRSSGTFLLTTTRLTRPGRYDFYVVGNIMLDGQQEAVYSRPLGIVIEPLPADGTEKETSSADATNTAGR